ncbi:hypothetical protein [Pseudovibrio sp. Ad37]|uniref:hypothetical protein n=1 Tax=Pseudovibrio sp. Ad37 TaxID=989422 RepID=UPI0007B19591|nr:hypothetical protein [Pseudovibrio sp. Ad37]KZL19160.1 hypothetical protein PsAD37_03719 [Pseudovibrio sp. Ad37]
MHLPFFSLISLLLITPALADTPPLQIIIEADVASPMSGTATVSFPTPQNIKLLKPRTLRGDTETSAIQFLFDGIQKANVAYEEQFSCRELQWTVTFQNVQTAPHAIANQQNLYSPAGWWT